MQQWLTSNPSVRLDILVSAELNSTRVVLNALDMGIVVMVVVIKLHPLESVGGADGISG